MDCACGGKRPLDIPKGGACSTKWSQESRALWRLISDRSSIYNQYINMDVELVKQLETANDGQSIHLFFDETVGVYMAFGLSAYYSTLVVTPYVLFSEALQMPVALLRKGHINALRPSTTKLEHTSSSYYLFRMRQKVGDAVYEKWMSQVIKKTEL